MVALVCASSNLKPPKYNRHKAFLRKYPWLTVVDVRSFGGHRAAHLSATTDGKGLHVQVPLTKSSREAASAGTRLAPLRELNADLANRYIALGLDPGATEMTVVAASPNLTQAVQDVARGHDPSLRQPGILEADNQAKVTGFRVTRGERACPLASPLLIAASKVWSRRRSKQASSSASRLNACSTESRAR